ncbi:MAG: GNAT family N-acetyltransferase [Caulobacter sp.]|nr:GNAT family N-acetyltransferase [Caulobacter sp.]
MCAVDTTPRIETRRLSLRPPRPEDAPRLARLCDDLDIVRMTSTMPWPYGLDDARSFIAMTAMADPRSDAAFLIELDDQGVVGGLGFSTGEAGRASVGYWVGRAWQGRGLASEALVGAMDWAARCWRKRVVAAVHFSDNPASGRVLCRAGFLYTGQVDLLHSRARREAAPARRMIWLA